MQLKWIIILFVFFVVFHKSLMAQISPPGLSDTHVASWMAVGLDQQLDTQNKRRSITYIGIGRMSDPAGATNLFKKPSIFILNEEYKQKITDKFSYTAALSYRRQNLYEEIAPYHKADPAIRQEFRVYGKLAYGQTNKNVKWNLDFRPEFRKFFLPDFGQTDALMALRARFKAKAEISLASSKAHVLIVSAESLFQSDQINKSANPDWTGFYYDDSRFCLYYRFIPKDVPVYFEIGYMNNLVGTKPAKSVHHFGVDLVFKNLFGY